jgi:hypothetical protein
LCEEALNLATSTNDPFMISSTWLACAEMMLDSRQSQPALEKALQAQEAFSRSGRLDSEWRAWLIAARASQQLGHEAIAQEFASKAKDCLAKLEQRLGSDWSRGYLSRKDIQNFQQQLNQASSLPGSP